jgi:hypothetical protein
MSAFPPPSPAARIAALRSGIIIEAVEHVLQSAGIHKHAAAVKRRKGTRRRQWLLGDLLEQSIDSPAHEFADRSILVPRHGPQAIHHRIGKQNLYLLHVSML